MELSNCLSPRSEKFLVKYCSWGQAFVSENTRGIFQNDNFPQAYFKMVTFLLPCQKHKGIFLWCHCENLVEFLEVNPHKAVAPVLLSSQSMICLPQCVNHRVSVPTSYWLQKLLLLVSWSCLWFSVSTYFSSFQGGNVSCDLNYLMDLRGIT